MGGNLKQAISHCFRWEEDAAHDELPEGCKNAISELVRSALQAYHGTQPDGTIEDLGEADTPTAEQNHPIQPVEKDEHGHFRFKENKIVRYLLDGGPFDLNHLAVGNFSREDHEQFAQLIGYSLGGFAELSYVRDETCEASRKMSEGHTEAGARIAALEEMLARVRACLSDAATAVFAIHPDDLHA